MNRNMPFYIIALGTLAFGAVILLNHPTTTEVKVNREFVCYDDGVLVERHVGVKEAYHQDNGEWHIYYTDPQTAWYKQDNGETCQVEDNRVATILDEDS